VSKRFSHANELTETGHKSHELRAISPLGLAGENTSTTSSGGPVKYSGYSSTEIGMILYRIAENANGRRITLLMFATISGSVSPGCTRSFAHSGSLPKARHNVSRAAKSS
jgi:hypothetical protein